MLGKRPSIGRRFWLRHDYQYLLQWGFVRTPHSQKLARFARRNGLAIDIGPRERVIWFLHDRCIELLRPDGTRYEDAVDATVLHDYRDAYTAALARAQNDLSGYDDRTADYLRLLERYLWSGPSARTEPAEQGAQLEPAEERGHAKAWSEYMHERARQDGLRIDDATFYDHEWDLSNPVAWLCRPDGSRYVHLRGKLIEADWTEQRATATAVLTAKYGE